MDNNLHRAAIEVEISIQQLSAHDGDRIHTRV
jgi:hypothetical protein